MKKPPLHTAFFEFQNITKILEEDVAHLDAQLRENPNSQILRRAYLKALFTRTEGHHFAFKQTLLALEEILCPLPSGPRILHQRINLFSEPERMILLERQYRLKGSVATEDNLILRLDENLKFAFRVYQQALRIPVDHLAGGPRFDDLMAAQKKRNDLTHPKSAHDLEVTEEDLSQAKAGSDWYFATIDLLLDRAAIESMYYRSFSPAPKNVVDMVAKLVEAGAILKTTEGMFQIGLMKQINRTDWFYWPIDAEPTHPGRIINAMAFATSDEMGLLVDFFLDGAAQELRPIRWVCSDEKERQKRLNQHTDWLRRWHSDVNLRALVESKIEHWQSSS